MDEIEILGEVVSLLNDVIDCGEESSLVERARDLTLTAIDKLEQGT